MRNSTGMPSSRAPPSALNDAGMSAALICSRSTLLAHSESTPRKAYSVPRVTTSEGTLATATIAPLINPHTAPTAMPASTTSTTGTSGAFTSSVPEA